MSPRSSPTTSTTATPRLRNSPGHPPARHPGRERSLRRPPRPARDREDHHRTFSRTKVEIGRCDVYGEKKAIYRSREARAKVCEGCYARIVREWNGRAGVR
nr:hypothetical protein [Methanoculleus marisnigri]